MSEPNIETTEEMLASAEAMREMGWDPSDEDDSFVLRRMWMAGRDFARAAHTAPSDAVKVAAEQLLIQHRGPLQDDATHVSCGRGCGTYPCNVVLVARAALSGQAGGGEQRLRDAMGKAQNDLIQCSLHRTLCVHERDAQAILNDALLADAFDALAAPAEGEGCHYHRPHKVDGCTRRGCAAPAEVVEFTVIDNRIGPNFGKPKLD